MALTIKQEKELIQTGLLNNPRWSQRALEVIYQLQTEDEKCSHQTSHDNKVGFTAFDAEFLTDIAKKLKSAKDAKQPHFDWKPYGINDLYLSRKQLAVVGKMMTKYWRQLMNLKRAKEATA